MSIDAICSTTHKEQVPGDLRFNDDVAAMMGRRMMARPRGRERPEVNVPVHGEQIGSGC
ncbi:MAG: hypothetical protein ABI583_09250 [Betaproteobacteria bacterium]